MRKTKQVIVVRRDLEMSKGKLAAQVAHASNTAVFSVFNIYHNESKSKGIIQFEFNNDSPLKNWMENGSTKIVLGISSEDSLLGMFYHARRRNIPAEFITDEGRTFFKGVPTITCMAIGPYWADEIDKVSGELVLY